MLTKASNIPLYLFTTVGMFWLSYALLSRTSFVCGAGWISPVGQIAIHPSIGKVVAFGDSASDNGTGAWTISRRTWPADHAYYGHRFTNGPTWVENLAERLETELIDNAIGGSTSNNSFVQGFTGRYSDIPVPSAVDQLDSHLNAHHVSPEDLHVILTGGNDIFFAKSIEAIIPAIESMVLRLNAKGATKFLLASYPKLDELPFRRIFPDPSSDLFGELSSDLRKALVSLRNRLCLSGLEVGFVDIYNLFRQMIESPLSFGFDPDKVTKNCLIGAYGNAPRRLCRNPDKYIYWDEYHMTRVVHRYIGELGWKASQILCDSSVADFSELS